MSLEAAHDPDLIALARQALQAGERSRAQRLLSEVLSRDASRVDAWLLLAAVVDQPDRRRYCLERALALQPNHTAARHAYQALMQSASPPDDTHTGTIATAQETVSKVDPSQDISSAPQTHIETSRGVTASLVIAPELSPPANPAPIVREIPPKKRRRSCLLALTALATLAVLALLAALAGPGLLGLPEVGLAGPVLLEPAAWRQLIDGAIGAENWPGGAEQPLAVQPGAATALPTLGLPRPPTWTPTASRPPETAAAPRPTFSLLGANSGPMASITPFWGEWALVIGHSVEGRPLEVVRFGTGKKERMIVAGIHGGDEWNTIALADELIAHVRRRPGLVPPGYTLYILRALNPDGEARAHGPDGRYNANGVDLNRNFDTNWKSVWRSSGCSSAPGTGGSGPGSEPETQALQAFLAERHVEVLISYHSAGLGVFPSGDPAQPGSVRLAQGIAAISNYVYPPIKTGCEYTGTLVDWAADHGVVAAVDLELNSLNETEFDVNRKILELLMIFEPEK